MNRGHTKKIKKIVSEGAGPNGKNYFGKTPLISTISSEYPALITSLVAAGADVNLEDSTGRTPLIYAVYCGKENMIKVLLEEGADPNLKGRLGRTPLQCTEHLVNNKKTREILIAAGARNE